MTSTRLTLPHRALRLAAIVAGIAYLVWNAWWLAHARFAPSMVTYASGIPCPTTGGTHAFQALLAGDLGASLRYNPMVVPLLLLMASSVGWIAVRALRRKPIDLPAPLAYGWGGVLVLAGVIQVVRWAVT